LDKAAHYRSSGAMENERSALQRAEKLWKGPALSNIPSDMLHREETPRLNDQWFDVLERRFTIDLSLGDIDGLAPQIRQAITHRPERERYWEQLIEALHRIGRTTEALNEYRKVHTYLTGELGIEPRASLQRLHMEVLRQAELVPGQRPLPLEESAPVRGARSGGPSPGVPGKEAHGASKNAQDDAPSTGVAGLPRKGTDHRVLGGRDQGSGHPDRGHLRSAHGRKDGDRVPGRASVHGRIRRGCPRRAAPSARRCSSEEGGGSA